MGQSEDLLVGFKFRERDAPLQGAEAGECKKPGPAGSVVRVGPPYYWSFWSGERVRLNMRALRSSVLVSFFPLAGVLAGAQTSPATAPAPPPSRDSSLSGAALTVANSKDLGIGDPLVDTKNSADTKLAFTFALTKDVPTDTKLQFIITKPSKDGSAAVVERVDFTVKYGPGDASTVPVQPTKGTNDQNAAPDSASPAKPPVNKNSPKKSERNSAPRTNLN